MKMRMKPMVFIGLVIFSLDALAGELPLKEFNRVLCETETYKVREDKSHQQIHGLRKFEGNVSVITSKIGVYADVREPDSIARLVSYDFASKVSSPTVADALVDRVNKDGDGNIVGHGDASKRALTGNSKFMMARQKNERQDLLIKGRSIIITAQDLPSALKPKNLPITKTVCTLKNQSDAADLASYLLPSGKAQSASVAKNGRAD
jgi:hypothetical protein